MASQRPLDDDADALARRARALRRGPRGGDVVPERARREAGDEIDEGPSADDIQRFGDVTRRCPECGKDVFDDVAICYHCGYAMEKTSTPGKTPMWVIVTVVVVLLAILAWAL